MDGYEVDENMHSLVQMFVDGELPGLNGKSLAITMPMHVMAARVAGEFYAYRVYTTATDDEGWEYVRSEYNSPTLFRDHERAKSIGEQVKTSSEQLEILEVHQAYYGLVAFPNSRVYRTKALYQYPEHAITHAALVFDEPVRFVRLGEGAE